VHAHHKNPQSGPGCPAARVRLGPVRELAAGRQGLKCPKRDKPVPLIKGRQPQHQPHPAARA
jgi:hypothetical protein